MPYHIDADKISLNKLRKRIEATDLVPSRVSLLEEIGSNFKALENANITTLASLRSELKNAKRQEAVATRTGIDKQYLILLRRETEGYFPKPVALSKFDWLPQVEIGKLEKSGIRNAALAYEATRSARDIAELAKSTGVDVSMLETLSCLVELTRIRWVSPLTARILLDAGYTSVEKVAAADAEALCDDLARVNEVGKYFKGKIGLRDVHRLVRAADNVLDWESTA